MKFLASLVKAYIKTVVAPAYNKDGVLSFGTGSITEGVHKIPVKVALFKPDDSKHLSKGLCVMVNGSVSRTGKLVILCKDIASIEVLENEDKMDEQLVSNANKPLKRWDPVEREKLTDKRLRESMEMIDENKKTN